MDFQQNSFAEWEFTADFWAKVKAASYTTDLQMVFRSRDSDGGLLFAISGGDEYMKLQVNVSVHTPCY